MTDDELGELLKACPTLFHMAAAGSWPSIQRHGLLSTSALLDRFGTAGMPRRRLEEDHRASSVCLGAGVVIRDQKPMGEARLRRCLPEDMQPSDWYRLLNGRVFFWLTLRRLHTLLEAAPYRAAEHDVLEIDAERLVADYRPVIELCPINSGAVGRSFSKRDRTTFRSIQDYDFARRRRSALHSRPAGECVVELTIPGGVPDIGSFVRRVVSMRGRVVTRTLYQRQASAAEKVPPIPPPPSPPAPP